MYISNVYIKEKNLRTGKRLWDKSHKKGGGGLTILLRKNVTKCRYTFAVTTINIVNKILIQDFQK